MQVITRNLNKIIDKNYYPIEESRKSNMRHRPIGVGIQGLADALVLMGVPFDSPEAVRLSARIAECMYHAAVLASVELAERDGPYETFAGSPASEGRLQFDMWGVVPEMYDDWDAIKARVVRYGMRNSLLVASMPTASTSQILGFNEAFEPFSSLIYKRKTLAGEFIVINKYLVDQLERLGLWSEDMRERIVVAGGSIADIDEIPADVKDLYKICWEIKQRHVMDMAVARGPYTCQSQSMNLFMQDADFTKLNSAHFYSWSAGLKTGVYYLRTRQKASAQQFTMPLKRAPVAAIGAGEQEKPKQRPAECTGDVCVMCQG